VPLRTRERERARASTRCCCNIGRSRAAHYWLPFSSIKRVCAVDSVPCAVICRWEPRNGSVLENEGRDDGLKVIDEAGGRCARTRGASALRSNGLTLEMR
jgi:hypothetical protein